MFLRDYPRGLVNHFWLWWFPALDALPVAPALALALLLPRRRFPVSSLRLPPPPLPRLLPTPLAAIALARSPRMKTLFTPLQQTVPPSRPTCPALPPASRLLFTRACKILEKAHGRCRLPEALAL